MTTKLESVYIVDGARTPFIKALAKPNPLSAASLAVAAARPLLLKQPFLPQDLDEVIVGCVAPAPDETNIGRLIALRLGCGDYVPGWTVQRNCASGLQAIDSAYKDIALGRHDLVLAGGTESMSRTPLLLQEDMVSFLAEFKSGKSWLQKIKALLKIRPHFFVPVISLLKGLYDPIVNLSMGQTAEKLAYQFKISRREMDEFSLQSHLRALQGFEKGYFSEINPLFDFLGNDIERDNGIRPDSTLEKLAKLKPAFDIPYGLLTAGNSSQVSDGAAFVILASQKAIERYHLPILGKIVKTTWSALDPSIMGLGPAYAIAKLLQQENLTLKDIDYFEINEAYAAQVLACIKALQSQDFCREELHWQAPVGEIPIDKLNVDGGAIAIGHPVGASGARITLHLLQVLQRNQAKRGIASLCIGGGQGGAILLERAEG